MDTAFTTETPYRSDLEEVTTVAPEEVKNSVSALTNAYCEKMAHCYLFPSGRYGYKVPRDIPLSANQFFNQQFLNYSQAFAADSDYIFFAHSVMQKIQLNNQINVAMRKIASKNLSDGMLNKSIKSSVKQFIAQGKAYSFIILLRVNLHT